MSMHELRMYYSAACILIGFVIGGCMPQPIVEPQKPEPVVAKEYDTAAVAYIDSYKAGLSKAAAEVAAGARSGAYADMIEVNSAWVKGSQEARIEAQKVLIERMNANKDLEVSDPKVAEMFEKLSAGWSKQ